MVNTDVVGILVNSSGISTIARASSLAIDDNLGVKTNWGCSLKIVQDVEAVSNSRGGSLGPA
jgi:hypothetical protein